MPWRVVARVHGGARVHLQQRECGVAGAAAHLGEGARHGRRPVGCAAAKGVRRLPRPAEHARRRAARLAAAAAQTPRPGSACAAPRGEPGRQHQRRQALHAALRLPVLEEAVGVQFVELIPVPAGIRLQPVDLSLSAALASAAKDATHATAAVSRHSDAAFQRIATRLRQRLLLRRPARLHCGTRGGAGVVPALTGGSPVTRPTTSAPPPSVRASRGAAAFLRPCGRRLGVPPP